MRVGAVIIGRNEGARLVRCLKAAASEISHIVYVDSGSSDDSLNEARKVGAEVVELDMRMPFTAARARNAGVARLSETAPCEMVQFMDGDCELQKGWIALAALFLQDNPRVGMVGGRCREKFPEASVYNRMCDEEWDTPIGEACAVGGNAMIRTAAFDAVGGFNPAIIAGEEPELCVRLRAAGWRVWRLDAEMVLHDAAMTRFGQWWTRARRGGHAFAEGAALHGAPPERHYVRQTLRALLWGAGLPLVVLVLAVMASPWALLLLLVYPVQTARLAFRAPIDDRFRWIRAAFMTLGKFPEALGIGTYWWRRLWHKPAQLIEYK